MSNIEIEVMRMLLIQSYEDGYNRAIEDAIERLKKVMPSYLMTYTLLSLRKKEGGEGGTSKTCRGLV